MLSSVVMASLMCVRTTAAAAATGSVCVVHGQVLEHLRHLTLRKQPVAVHIKQLQRRTFSMFFSPGICFQRGDVLPQESIGNRGERDVCNRRETSVCVAPSSANNGHKIWCGAHLEQRGAVKRPKCVLAMSQLYNIITNNNYTTTTTSGNSSQSPRITNMHGYPSNRNFRPKNLPRPP